MISDILETIASVFKSRMFYLGLILIGLFSILICRLFDLQIVNEDFYLDTYIQKAEKELSVPATRGLIYDCKGNVLAYNELAYAVTIEDQIASSNEKNSELNEIIYNTICIIEGNGDNIKNDFSIIIDSNGNYDYSVTSETAKLRFLKNIYGENLDTKKHTYSNATAGEVYEYLKNTKYEISDDYGDYILKIMMIRYNLSLNSFKKYIATTIATNVSDKTVAAIYENSADLTGVNISEEYVRVYNDSEYFAPILGYTGTISEEQLEELNNAGGDYISSDIVGKSGIEESMESELQGTRGTQTVFVDSTGTMISTIDSKDAVSGNDVYLTLDRDLQIATYNLLEQKIAGILVSEIVNYDVDDEQDSDDGIILISAKEVYFQLINNNVININHFSSDDATDNEKKVYSAYKNYRNSVLSKLETQLTDLPVAYSELSDEYAEYSTIIFDELKALNVIISSSVDTDSTKYKKWSDGDISLKEILTYAISNDWINISKLDIEEEYATTDEIYNALVKYIIKSLKSDTAFAKKIYYYCLNNGFISGSQICILLYDQNVLDYNESWYNKLLANNSEYAYNFIIKQITDLAITPAQIALDPCSGSTVVTNPDTGAVLALVTYPSYDNNMLSGTVDADYWNMLLADGSNPLYNRATQTLLAPGSTFKMISALAALEEGIVGVYDELYDAGEFTKITPSPKCWIYPASHGWLNVMEALSKSCNGFFYETGYQLGLDSKGNYNSDLGLKKLKKYADMVGITSKSGIEIIENEPNFSTQSAVHSAIGQGSNAYSPVQIARYISTIANGGNNYELTLISKVTTSENELVYQKEPVLTNTVDCSEETMEAIHKGLRMVITEGTVQSLFANSDLKIAGKSGTAQESKLRNTHAVFVAYAPYDEPEITVTVVLPYGDASGNAATLTKSVMEYYFGETSLKQILKGKASVPSSAANTHD
ncbi:MAG: penicillin-binding transpeptidase domain-containing protein [Eubacterium sp.]